MKLFTFKMKHMARLFSALIAILLISVQVGLAQSQTVTGVVLDENSNPIIGANVVIEGTTSGVTTGIDGDFALSVAPNSTLVFSYVGYRTISQPVSGATTNMEISLMPSAVDLDEVVVVGYNTQSRVSVTGAVVSVKAEELETVATSNVGTALTGHMPGVTVVQNSGWAGEGASSINVRGVSSDSSSDPLVLVDGFERDLNDLDMSEVETISVLKDASATAVYGVRGANGVIIITTKKGVSSNKIRFNFKAEAGVSVMGDIPELLSSYDYARYLNVAIDNDVAVGSDASTKFTDEQIEGYRTSASLEYPNMDYQEWAFGNGIGYQQRYSLSMQGGNDKIKYYNSVSYNYEKDATQDYGQGYDASSWYDKINIRSNIEAQLTKTTKLSLNLGAQFSTRNRPNKTMNNILVNCIRTLPGLYAGIIDGHVAKVDTGHYSGHTATQATEILEELYDVGYVKLNTNKIQSTFALSQNLDMITKGLNLDLYYAYDNSNYTQYTMNKNNEAWYLTYVNPNNSDDYTLAPSSTGNSQSTSARTTVMNSVNTSFRAMLNYNRTFGNDHNITALAVYNLADESFHTDDYYYVPYRTMEVAGKVAYAYKSRYFADVNVGVSGSENFHPDYRYGVFPAVSAGWVVSNEDFFPKNNVLNFLKLKASYGLTGNDQGTERFYYSGMYEYDSSSGYYFGGQMTGEAQGSSSETRQGNPSLTWETNTQLNVGVNTQWFNNRLVVDAEYFSNYRKDILQEPQSVAATTGISTLAYMNMKEISTTGYEVAVNWSDNIGKFNYSVGGNVSFYNNVLEEMGELTPSYDYQAMTGRGIDQFYGLDFVSFYTQDEIDLLQTRESGGFNVEDDGFSLPTGYNIANTSALQAGDCKYADLNGDGFITDDDMTYFDSMTVPPYSYAASIRLNYKNWGLDMLWQGTAGAMYEIYSFYRIPFFNQAQTNTAAFHLDSWTPETADTARFPRLSQAYASTASGNYGDSDLWLEKSNYIRLKNLEVSYKLSSQACEKLRIESMRIYASGYNLLTITPLEWFDPEFATSSSSSFGIPPSKIFNLGVQVSF